MQKREQGFTLIELMIVVAIIAIIAAVAVPNLLSAKLAANESNAISTLRNLVSAQAQFQSIGAMDDDLDGSGEFGCFGELVGLNQLNTRANANGPAAVLDPPILGNSFSVVDANGNVTKSGYAFRIMLPDAGGAAGTPEVGAGAGNPSAPDANWDADACETFWCAYAWPVDAGTTGNRAFFVNQRGEIYQTRMDAAPYSGTGAAGAGTPDWDSALNTAATNDMSAPIGIVVAGASTATDTNTWTAVQ